MISVEASTQRPATTPQPPDERPDDEDQTTVIFSQPDDERATPAPSGTVDVHILPPRPTPESNVLPYSCKQDNRFYQDKEKWRVGECTNCTCIRGKVECQTDEDCLASLRPTREPHFEQPYPGWYYPTPYFFFKQIFGFFKRRTRHFIFEPYNGVKTIHK